MVATFGMSRPAVLVLLSAFPSVGRLFSKFTQAQAACESAIEWKESHHNRREGRAGTRAI
jgi:hypothetical protein